MADVSQLKDDYRRHCAERFDRAVSDFTETMRANLPVKTGRLRDTFTVTVQGGGFDVLNAEALMPVDYAEMLDTGTRPHLIVARAGRVLVFDVGGQTVFTPRVEHPGFPSQEIWEKPAPVVWQSSLERAFG